jgi:hypothetical protein
VWCYVGFPTPLLPKSMWHKKSYWKERLILVWGRDLLVMFWPIL